MPSVQAASTIHAADRAGDVGLRFVFSDALISLDVAPSATYQDLAQHLWHLSQRHFGDTVAVYATIEPEFPRLGNGGAEVTASSHSSRTPPKGKRGRWAMSS